jgi:outer membrane receptor protein involved in Fe transport
MANLCVPFRSGIASSKNLLALSIALAITPKLATAQQQSADQQVEEQVVVTGSRIARSGFDSAQPLSIVDAEQIENLGLVNVGDAIRLLPQNTPFFTDTNVGIGNFNVGAQLANLRGLNPYFGTRTLTLVDTKRVVPNTEGGAIDLTLIPSMLVGRTEVVTGGASAAYGSDAIAGVVNVILDTDLEGFKAQVDFSDVSGSGGSDRHGSFAYGQAFNDGRVHLILGVEHQQQDPIGPCSQNRDWCRESWVVANNADFSTGNGFPNFVVAPNGKFATSENGIIAPCLDAACAPGTGRGAFQSFNADGTDLVPYDPGMWTGGFGGRVGGDGTILAYDVSSIRPDVERTAALGHVDIDLSGSLTLSFELAKSQSDSLNHPANGGLGPFGGGVFIAPDNAFLTPELQAALPFGGFMNRIFAPDVLSATNTTEAETTRFVTSLEGDFEGGWGWDAYYEHGESEYHQQLIHNADRSILGIPPPANGYAFFGWATDAVRSDPNDPNSPIVCRATIVTNPPDPPNPAFHPNAAGCVPLNFFGVGNSDPAAIDYVWRTLKEDSDYTQDVVGVNFRGEIADGWGAGPISAAFGGEIRSDESDVTHDLANQPWGTSYLLSWGQDRGGKIDVAEIYAEVQVPIVERVNADFGVRRTSNEATSLQAGVPKNSHDFTSWKAAVIYDATDIVRIRATSSRDVRGAGFRELFIPRITQLGTVGGFPAGIENPWNNNIEEDYTVTTGGNPFLNPEEADTSAFGAVLSFDRLQFSADWYEIDLGGAIVAGPGAQNVVDACFRGAQAACDNIVRTGSGASTDIVSVENSSINLASYLTRGIDFEVNYNVPLARGDSLNFRVISSYLYDMIIDTGLGDAPINYHGQSGPVGAFGGFNTSPDWQANAWLTYNRSRLTTTLEMKYVGSGSLSVLRFDSPIGASTNTLQNSISDNSVDSRLYLSWAGSYDFELRSGENQLQLFWSINNLLDKDPPVAPGGNAYPTNPVFFDTIGRRIRTGLRLEF